MKSCFSWWLPVGVLCLPSFVVGQNKPGAENPNVQLTLGKKTTVIVTPVDSRGRPDYMAAINQRHAQGVTAANNAAIALLEAVGPNEIPPPEREDFFKRLGMKSLPATGAYYVSLKKYGQELIEKQQRTAAEIYGTELWSLKRTESVTQQLWNEDEAPLAAQWLRRNQGALDLLERGSAREAVLTPADLETGDAVFLGNSVRGLLPAAPLDARVRQATGT